MTILEFVRAALVLSLPYVKGTNREDYFLNENGELACKMPIRRYIKMSRYCQLQILAGCRQFAAGYLIVIFPPP